MQHQAANHTIYLYKIRTISSHDIERVLQSTVLKLKLFFAFLIWTFCTWPCGDYVYHFSLPAAGILRYCILYYLCLIWGAQVRSSGSRAPDPKSVVTLEAAGQVRWFAAGKWPCAPQHFVGRSTWTISQDIFPPLLAFFFLLSIPRDFCLAKERDLC